MSIKTSDLRPCDNCGGPIAPVFYRLEVGYRQMLIDYHAVNQVLGTAQMLGNNLLLGSIMSPDSDAVTEIGGSDRDYWLCQTCAIAFTVSVADLMIEDESLRDEEE